MDATTFFETHPLFTREEFARALDEAQPRTRKAVEAMLGLHKRAGRIVNVRRGLYASAGPGEAPDEVRPEPLAVACKIADDAILAHATALELNGGARVQEGEENRLVQFFTNSRPRPTTFQGVTYEGLGFPVALRDRRMEEFGVVELATPAGMVRATGPERTLVDMLDRPGLSGGWELVWVGLGTLGGCDGEGVVEYAGLLANATTSAKVGLFLAEHRDRHSVSDEHLRSLEAMVPSRPHYLERTARRSGRLVRPWNLVLPFSFLKAMGR